MANMNAKQLAVKGLRLNPESPLTGAREVAKNANVRFRLKEVEQALENIRVQEAYSSWLSENEFD